MVERELDLALDYSWYDPQANGMAETCAGVMERLQVAVTPGWSYQAIVADAITRISEVRNQTKRDIDDTMVEPLFLELTEDDETAKHLAEEDIVEFWPPWGCQAIAPLPLAARDDKLSPVALMGVFLGYDKTIVNGIRVGVSEGNFRKCSQPAEEVIVSTTVRLKESNDGLTRESLEQRGQRRHRNKSTR